MYTELLLLTGGADRYSYPYQIVKRLGLGLWMQLEIGIGIWKWGMGIEIGIEIESTPSQEMTV